MESPRPQLCGRAPAVRDRRARRRSWFRCRFAGHPACHRAPRPATDPGRAAASTDDLASGDCRGTGPSQRRRPPRSGRVAVGRLQISARHRPGRSANRGAGSNRAAAGGGKGIVARPQGKLRGGGADRGRRAVAVPQRGPVDHSLVRGRSSEARDSRGHRGGRGCDPPWTAPTRLSPSTATTRWITRLLSTTSPLEAAGGGQDASSHDRQTSSKSVVHRPVLRRVSVPVGVLGWPRTYRTGGGSGTGQARG